MSFKSGLCGKCQYYYRDVFLVLVVLESVLIGSLGQELCKGRLPEVGEVNTTYSFSATAEQPCNFIYLLDLSALDLSQILVRQLPKSSLGTHKIKK
jgi:hypothetical protein